MRKTLFESKHQQGEGFKLQAELYNPNGYFVMCFSGVSEGLDYNDSDEGCNHCWPNPAFSLLATMKSVSCHQCLQIKEVCDSV